MINWTGKAANGIWKRKEMVRTMSELYDVCVENGTISLVDYDPYGKYILEREGYSYEAAQEEIIALDEELNDFSLATKKWWSEHNIDSTMTDYDYFILIKSENGNAFYQTFTDENGNELEFDESGIIINK